MFVGVDCFAPCCGFEFEFEFTANLLNCVPPAPMEVMGGRELLVVLGIEAEYVLPEGLSSACCCW